jgi:S1-C subfamily serine protease
MKTVLSTIFALFILIQASGQCLSSENAFKDYFKSHISSLDQIEGIWSVSADQELFDEYKQLRAHQDNPQAGFHTIIKKDDYYIVCQNSTSSTSSNMRFYRAANPTIYLFSQDFPQSRTVGKANAVLSNNGVLEFSIEIPDREVRKAMGNSYISGMSCVLKETWIKTYPTESEYKSDLPSSGTGFAITSNGIIATNYHVIKDAASINIRGVAGNFSKTYSAKVITEDKNNDLALVQISDNSFSSLGTIPYILPNRSCDVGTSVFCLGYPLISTMGEEVKLTNGIINSKSGFQGDITTYQVSTPVQPGNSGGPLFDDRGNLIGIINSKLTGTENVSYAIKVSYLLNLIDLMPTTPDLQAQSLIIGKSMPEQVKILKNFIYIIEVNKK